MYYYLQVATQYKYDIVIMEPETPWKWKDDKLAIKNIHSVPSDKIKRMKQNYESGVSLVELLGSLNLELPREPLMRNFPPIEPPTPPMEESPIIDFRPDENLLQSLLGKEQSSETFQWKPPPQIFNDNWETMGDEIPQEKQLKKESTNPQPQRKQRKNKQKQSLSLSPHCQFCPNENPAFTQFREVYPQVNDIYLWDFFEKCKGDAEYAIGLLCEENLSDDIMNSRNELTCKCFSSAIPKNSEDVKQSPVVVKPKKSRSENNIAKNNSLDEWFETKKVIEESITMHDDHYPEHVRLVKSWKRGTKIETEVEPETVSNTVIHCEEEMMSVPIGNDLILELDKEFGGALLEYDMETNPFPPKILLKRSTAHQLYFDIIEAYYSQIEEAKLLSIKKDEELAKTLAEQEKIEKYPEIYQAAEPKDLKDIIELQEAKKRFEKEFLQSEYKPDDWALTLSKEKLIGIFPDIPKTDLMNIFAGFDYNFNETVQALQDSCQLDTNQSERKKLIEAQNNIFNLPTTNEPPPGLQSSDDAEDSEDLKTIELLRETIDFHRNSQKCAQEKIRDAVSSKQYDVATYYSNISRLHKKKAEESSHDVANLVALLHEKSHGEDAVLDLHFFNHIEAGTILDTFLDKNISKLRAMKKPYVELFIITGRGKNSVNGIATIKNKSKIRLGQRNLKLVELYAILFFP